MSGSIPAGWYPDPQDPATIRWWDGAQWTSHVQPRPDVGASAETTAADVAAHASSRSGRIGGWPLVIGLLAGTAISVGGFLLTLNLLFAGSAIPWPIVPWLIVLLAGIGLMFWKPARSYAVGALISLAAAPIVLLGVSVVMLTGYGL
jgi:hypothetical protein